eukprot:3337905-Pleurochrysis_carterae.AAC.1
MFAGRMLCAHSCAHSGSVRADVRSRLDGWQVFSTSLNYLGHAHGPFHYRCAYFESLYWRAAKRSSSA